MYDDFGGCWLIKILRYISPTVAGVQNDDDDDDGGNYADSYDEVQQNIFFC